MQLVPFFKYSDIFSVNEDAFVATVRDVGRRGAFILQGDLREFERHLAEFVGAKFAIGVANATDGLHLLLRAAGLQLGDEVIISSHTMIATAAAVHFAGGVPVPVECGADHLMDSRAVRRAVTARTRVVMPTQLNGRTCDMDAIAEIADENGLSIVEDAAQALGSRYKDQSAGTFGLGGAISFYPAKVLGCFGYGGAVVTNDSTIYRQVLLLRDHGRDEQGNVVAWGLNSRLDNLQAAILDLQLAKYPGVIQRRRRIASLYYERLCETREIVLPPAPDTSPDHFDIFQNYEIEAEYRDGLQQYLKDHGIGTLIQWGGLAVHQLKALGFTQDLPYTDSLFTRLLMLPMNMSLSDEDVTYVSDIVRAFYGYAQ